MEIVALAGGVGAGRFLRGLDAVAGDDGHDITVVVNTGDDLERHGLRICPDLDSVCYWLAGVMDRDRGWGRGDETFHVLDALRAAGEDAWFALGDRDLATHLLRTHDLRAGATLTEATARLADRLGVRPRVLPMSDDDVTTMIGVGDPGDEGTSVEIHFQEYWVRRRGADPVRTVRYASAELARPQPAALEAIRRADAVLVCPSNPVASIGPILAVPGYREALGARRAHVAGISPIVGGAPLSGMADRLMPAVGLPVSALGAASAYRGWLGAWVLDEADRDAADRAAAAGLRVAVTDTVMRDDATARALARVALDLACVGDRASA